MTLRSYYDSLGRILTNKHFTQSGKSLSDRDNNYIQAGFFMLGSLVVDRNFASYQQISKGLLLKFFRCLDVNLDNWIAIQDHLLDAIRNPFSTDFDLLAEILVAFHMEWLVPTVLAYGRRHKIKWFKSLNTVAQFMSKMTLKDTDVEDDSFEAFFTANEQRKFSLSPNQRRIVEEIRSTLDSDLNLGKLDEAISASRLKFGPGASYECGRQDGLSSKVIVHLMGMLKARHVRLAQAIGIAEEESVVFSSLNERMIDNSETIARLIMVPKGIKKKRGITVEETQTGLLEQKVRDILLYLIERSEYHIFLNDQTVNKTLALIGSKSGHQSSLTTIDLHAASDSVTLALVAHLFRGTGLFRILMDSRSYLIEDSRKGKEKVTRLKSYAGMGNAVTFPLQSIVYASIVHLAARRLGWNRDFKYLPYSVYGDDIIVPDWLYDEVTSILTDLDFVVNDDKSFRSDTPFKESCGIEALSGHDVTPVRMSRKLYVSLADVKLPPEMVIPLASLTNNLYSQGYTQTASVLRRHWRLHQYSLRYTDDIDSVGLFIQPTNYPITQSHLRGRYNNDLQRFEVLALTMTEKQSKGMDLCNYWLWQERRSSDPFDLWVDKRKPLIDPETYEVCDEPLIRSGPVQKSRIYTSWLPV